MRLVVLLICVLAGPATGQTSGMPSPIHFHMKWDAHNASVRLRPLSDSLAVWTPAKAQRYRGDTFEVVDTNRRSLRFDNPAGWTVEARVYKEQRKARGRRIGSVLAVIGASAVVVNAFTCENRSAEGPGCGLVIMISPVAATGGMLLGYAVSAALPMREWQRVEVVVPPS
jgi:hypothetical protein